MRSLDDYLDLADDERKRAREEGVRDTSKKPIRIVALFAENCKNLRIAEFRPNPHVNRITGPNMSGKSSLVDSIMYTLGGAKTHPSQMIRRGEDRMTVRLDLGEMTAIRVARPDGDPDLRLEAESGAVLKKPQHLLEAIISELGWEPIKVMQMDRKEQLELLRKIVKVDIDLDAVDGEILRLMEERRLHRPTIGPFEDRRIKLWPQVHPEMDITPVSTAAVLDAIQQASSHNTTILHERVRREDEAFHAHNRRIEAGELREQARRLIEQAESFERTAANIEDQLAVLLPIAEPIDVKDLRVQLAAVEAEKAKRETEARIRDEYCDAYFGERTAIAKEEELTRSIETLRQSKRDAIARTKMPVPGLSFDDEGVTFNNLPLSQASQGEQWRVVIAIGMALNPRLRLLFIRQASLLDSKTWAIVEEMAEEFDFQVFGEFVQEEPGPVGIHMHEGRIAFIDGKPVDQEAELAAR